MRTSVRSTDILSRFDRKSSFLSFASAFAHFLSFSSFSLILIRPGIHAKSPFESFPLARSAEERTFHATLFWCLRPNSNVQPLPNFATTTTTCNFCRARVVNNGRLFCSVLAAFLALPRTKKRTKLRGVPTGFYTRN